MDIAKELQELRKNANYSLEQIADLLGISSQTVLKWETREERPPIETIVELAKIYGVSAEDIVFGKESDKFRYRKPENCVNGIFQKAIAVIAVVAGIGIVTVLFIAALRYLAI